MLSSSPKGHMGKYVRTNRIRMFWILGFLLAIVFGIHQLLSYLGVQDWFLEIVVVVMTVLLPTCMWSWLKRPWAFFNDNWPGAVYALQGKVETIVYGKSSRNPNYVIQSKALQMLNKAFEDTKRRGVKYLQACDDYQQWLTSDQYEACQQNQIDVATTKESEQFSGFIASNHNEPDPEEELNIDKEKERKSRNTTTLAMTLFAVLIVVTLGEKAIGLISLLLRLGPALIYFAVIGVGVAMIVWVLLKFRNNPLARKARKIRLWIVCILVIGGLVLTFIGLGFLKNNSFSLFDFLPDSNNGASNVLRSALSLLPENTPTYTLTPTAEPTPVPSIIEALDPFGETVNPGYTRRVKMETQGAGWEELGMVSAIENSETDNFNKAMGAQNERGRNILLYSKMLNGDGEKGIDGIIRKCAAIEGFHTAGYTGSDGQFHTGSFSSRIDVLINTGETGAITPEGAEKLKQGDNKYASYCQTYLAFVRVLAKTEDLAMEANKEAEHIDMVEVNGAFDEATVLEEQLNQIVNELDILIDGVIGDIVVSGEYTGQELEQQILTMENARLIHLVSPIENTTAVEYLRSVYLPETVIRNVTATPNPNAPAPMDALPQIPTPTSQPTSTPEPTSTPTLLTTAMFTSLPPVATSVCQSFPEDEKLGMTDWSQLVDYDGSMAQWERRQDCGNKNIITVYMNGPVGWFESTTVPQNIPFVSLFWVYSDSGNVVAYLIGSTTPTPAPTATNIPIPTATSSPEPTLTQSSDCVPLGDLFERVPKTNDEIWEGLLSYGEIFAMWSPCPNNNLVIFWETNGTPKGYFNITETPPNIPFYVLFKVRVENGQIMAYPKP